jgi:benzoyl-CoA reductase subunit C
MMQLMETMMENIKELRAVVDNPADYARTIKAGGKKIIGYMCTYAPEEIIQAAGAHPMRLFGSSKKILLADSHLQSYCCSLVRSVLEDALAGDMNFLDGMIFPHTCDSMQRLSDIWRLNVPYGFHLDVVLPVKLDTASARKYMIDVLNLFRCDLEKALKVKITDDDIRKSIALFNEIRSSLQKVYDLKKENPDAGSGNDIYTLVKAAMIMDRNSYLNVLKDIIAALGKNGSEAATRKKRLVLAGGICSQPDIYSMIEDVGGVVVGDDLCTGSRYFAGLISTTGDPIEAMAERYLQRSICPAKHLANSTRAENLLRKVNESNAAGVIFMQLKFCDPHAFDYPYLKNALTKAGISSLLLEVEDQPLAQGQMKTRIEAFLETL